MTIQLLRGDALSVLSTLPAGSIQTVITSPPYYGLRKYTNDPREIGQEAAPDCLAWARREPPCGACYVCALRAVFAAVWRVLRSDGTCWLNLGDSMSGKATGNPGTTYTVSASTIDAAWQRPDKSGFGIPDKNLLLIPARVALALQSDGWIVRSDVVWSKPNCMPESVTDRPTRAHEYVYLLSKQARYYYDADAIREPLKPGADHDRMRTDASTDQDKRQTLGAGSKGSSGKNGEMQSNPAGRNRRTVWTIATRPYAGAHFATFPEALVEIPLLAGSSAQACEHCGAAWGRAIEYGDLVSSGPNQLAEKTRSQNRHVYDGDLSERPKDGYGDLPRREKRDLGFAPRCVCADNTGAASSVVLDCFAGTGTVLRVAERFGRNAIGIELNPDYTELSDARTNGVQKELFV